MLASAGCCRSLYLRSEQHLFEEPGITLYVTGRPRDLCTTHAVLPHVSVAQLNYVVLVESVHQHLQRINTYFDCLERGSPIFPIQVFNKAHRYCILRKIVRKVCPRLHDCTAR